MKIIPPNGGQELIADTHTEIFDLIREWANLPEGQRSDAECNIIGCLNRSYSVGVTDGKVLGAASQVSVDERKMPPAFFYYEAREDGSIEWGEGCVSQDDTYTNSEFAEENGTHGGKVYSEAQMRAALAAAPVQAQQPVAEFGEDSIFVLRKQANGERFPKGTKLYATPVQPVAVQDGWKLVPAEPTDEMAVAAIKVTLGNVAINGVDQYRAMIAAAPAAPAAQGDAKGAERIVALLEAIRDGVPLEEPVSVCKAMMARRQARVVLDKGVGPLAAVHLVNIGVGGWVHTETTAAAYADGFNRGADWLRSSIIEYADKLPSASAAVAAKAAS